ncbi:hypothetical protein [Roseibium sp. M-1]
MGTKAPHETGVDINEPVLTVEATTPVEPPAQTPVTIKATTTSTDAIYTVNLIYQLNNEAKNSAIMAEKDGVWEVELGPFSAGDWINYYVSATDNSSRRVVTPVQRFVVQSGSAN